MEEAKADIVILNFGHWWYAPGLGNAFAKLEQGHHGQMMIRAYESVFFYGQELKKKYPHIQLVFKSTTPNNPDKDYGKAHTPHILN